MRVAPVGTVIVLNFGHDDPGKGPVPAFELPINARIVNMFYLTIDF